MRDRDRNSASYRLKLLGVLLAADEVEEACAEMGAVLDTCGGISSPRLLDKMRAFRQAAGRLDSATAQECTARIRETA
ncbi:hypothetical protein [Streptomyces sp. V1I1]|uniref:hypothetical protein n=1 Tax=Streptomyces sp. V1I1 TaxID=3042272 RepID=UPI0027D85874|nr:hypothetical protein [Streptomyces sp. V1I1]